jgi:uncharacterized protein YacL
MILHVLRALFVLLMAAVGFFFAFQPSPPLDLDISVVVAIAFAGLLVCVDILAPPHRKLQIFAGTFLGILVGLLVAYVLSFVVRLVVVQYFTGNQEAIIRYINMLNSVAACYLAISVIMQTKDDFRFIIPYVEFSKQTKGARPILVDTSVLIDGRITDIVHSGIVESQLVVPQFVLTELQQIADSGDKLKRNRGRRGLDVLGKLRNSEHSDVAIYDPHGEDEGLAVDQRLVTLAKDLNARVLTNDFNLNKVAQLRGVDVINLNDLANALKPAVLPGEKMTVRIIKPGEDPGQGVGYLDDGTMVVVEGARKHINEEIQFTVTNTRQTSAGKMIFGRLDDEPPPPPAGAPVRGPRPTPSPA